jgi:hypothetical protein
MAQCSKWMSLQALVYLPLYQLTEEFRTQEQRRGQYILLRGAETLAEAYLSAWRATFGSRGTAWHGSSCIGPQVLWARSGGIQSRMGYTLAWSQKDIPPNPITFLRSDERNELCNPVGVVTKQLHILHLLVNRLWHKSVSQRLRVYTVWNEYMRCIPRMLFGITSSDTESASSGGGYILHRSNIVTIMFTAMNVHLAVVRVWDKNQQFC